MPSCAPTSCVLSARATSSSFVLPYKSVLRFCSDCLDNRAPSFKTVPQVAVGMVTRAAAEAASICANLLVVHYRRESSLPLSTLKRAFRRRSLESSSWIQPIFQNRLHTVELQKGFCGDPPVHKSLCRPIQFLHWVVLFHRRTAFLHIKKFGERKVAQ